MREIKFRVWSESEQKYTYGLTRYLFGSDDNEKCTLCMPQDFNAIFEQYTGLKDKNGKEICEGDIVRCHGDDRFIAPVIRHDKSGGFCWVSCYKEECFIPEPDEVEVIGNIHENPELCGEEKECEN